MARFIVVVLDGFGIGEMSDVAYLRPQDVGANTASHLIQHFSHRRLPTLEMLGLLNTIPSIDSVMVPNKRANWGRSELFHIGCDTFMGHQEIMGTKPIDPVITPFNDSIEAIESALQHNNYYVERLYHQDLALLEVNGCVVIGDNLEADLGQVYNLTANLNLINFDEVKKIAQVVRKANCVSRNIAFGGCIDGMTPIYEAIEIRKNKNGTPCFIGVNAPASGTYEKGFQVVHLGYGVDATTQVPFCLNQVGITSYLYGKVADIVQNADGVSYTSIVDTERVFSLLINDLNKVHNGFFCANIQETDLSGHQQDPLRYWDTLELADNGLAKIIATMTTQDILVVMADHGNDPFIGHSCHTREMVPILVFHSPWQNKQFGTLSTLADVGASVADYFKAPRPQFGNSFLD
ncbi:phosphopentomutase [Photobacterium phosphoreum]|uniref:phosphopentomutase n=1 Tax=Photobacterium phosphoreum TaxID=659 RepID=UPI001E605C7C|nr:phosphopentomutase [Photobacterium phosphoreum]MCD9476466.1 phosphopentomutase [Photobacterium phosphoreum]MCF2177111.1 phosphopentomutase [Photobacterium phosphoreum]